MCSCVRNSMHRPRRANLNPQWNYSSGSLAQAPFELASRLARFTHRRPFCLVSEDSPGLFFMDTNPDCSLYSLPEPGGTGDDWIFVCSKRLFKLCPQKACPGALAIVGMAPNIRETAFCMPRVPLRMMSMGVFAPSIADRQRPKALLPPLILTDYRV